MRRTFEDGEVVLLLGWRGIGGVCGAGKVVFGGKEESGRMPVETRDERKERRIRMARYMTSPGFRIYVHSQSHLSERGCESKEPTLRIYGYLVYSSAML